MLFAVQFKTWYTCDWKHCYKRSLKPAYDIDTQLSLTFIWRVSQFNVTDAAVHCPTYQLSRDKDKLASNSNIPRKCARSAATPVTQHQQHQQPQRRLQLVSYTEVIVQPLSVFMHWPVGHVSQGAIQHTCRVRVRRQSGSVGQCQLSVLLWSVTVGPIFPVQRRCRTSLNNTWSSLSVCQCCQARCRPIIASNIQNI